MVRPLAISTALALALPACGPAPAIRGAGSFAPAVPSDPSASVLEARVLGAPGAVEFYLDGRRVRSADDWSWWQDARLVLELPPGIHALEARYRTGRFEGRALWNRVLAREPVRLEAGRTTRLLADLRREWTGVAEERVAYFQVREPVPPDAGGELESERAAFSTRDVPVDARLAWLEPGMTWQALVAGEPWVPLTPEPAGGRLAAEQITIRGREVLAGRRAGPPGVPSARAVRGPAAEAAPARAPGSVEVTVLLESEPPGAHVAVDDRYLGRAPLRVRLDPRADHLVQMEREGCDTHVQLLATDGWRRGRSPRLVVELDCR